MTTDKGLVAAIRDGDHDDELDLLAAAVGSRKQVLAGQVLAEFQPGDRVVFNRLCRPAYHIGEQATVIGAAPKKARNQKDKIIVKIDGSDRPMRVPPSIITKMRAES